MFAVDDVAARLHALILAAAADVVGPLSRRTCSAAEERPRASRRSAAGGCDFRCRPVTMFRRLGCRARERRRARRLPILLDRRRPTPSPRGDRVEHHPSGRGVEVTLKSQFGLARRRHHPDPIALADAILQVAAPSPCPPSVADVRVDPGDQPTGRDGGVLRVLTGDSSPSARPGPPPLRRAVSCSRAIRVCASTDGSADNSCGGSKSAVAESRMALAQLAPRRSRVRRLRRSDPTSPSLRFARCLGRLLAKPRRSTGIKRRATATSRRFVFSSRRRVGTRSDGGSTVDSVALGGPADSTRADYLVETLGMDPAAAQPRRTHRDGRRETVTWRFASGCTWSTGCPRTSRRATARRRFWAVWTGRLGACRWLVDVARAVGRRSADAGVTPRSGRRRAATCALEYLRGLGLDLGLLNDNGHSALHKAATKGHADACEWTKFA